MNLNDIPKEQTSNFPPNVSEATFHTMAEVQAFVQGLSYATDDVEASETFERNNLYVVRVQVGKIWPAAWLACE